VGLGRFELPTPRLSSVCSNQLSYRPLSQIELRSRISYRKSFKELRATLAPSKLDRRANRCVQPCRIPCQIDLSKLSSIPTSCDLVILEKL
jgi:hypothetical protein